MNTVSEDHRATEKIALVVWDLAWTGARDAPSWPEFRDKLVWLRAMRPVAALNRDGGFFDYVMCEHESAWRRAKRKHKLGDFPMGLDPAAVKLAQDLVEAHMLGDALSALAAVIEAGVQMPLVAADA